MVMVAAFPGVHYNPDKIDDFSSVVAPPYDVINSREQDELYERSPYNVIRLILSKGDGDEKYVRASETFRKWIEQGILVQDNQECVYPYYQEFEEGGVITRKGFIAAVRLEDFSSKNILPHERTFAAPKLDRLKLTSACRANLSPVFMIYSDPKGTLERDIEERLSRNPVIDAVGNDNVKNRMWKISDNDLISQIKNNMLDKKLLIADGHHRYETALEYRNIQRRERETGSGSERYEYVMVYLCRAESEGLVIKPTHRVVKNLGSLNTGEVLKKLEGRFKVERLPFNEGVTSLKHHEFAVITKDLDFVFKVSLKEPLPVSCDNLGVMTLHELVFGEVIDEEGSGIFYTKSLDEACNLVGGGEYKLAFILSPLRATDIFDVVLADEKMPHKTTYFYPKLLSGLVFHLLGK